jgi:hypothetical protein
MRFRVVLGDGGEMPGADNRSPTRCVEGGGRATKENLVVVGNRNSGTNSSWQERRRPARIVGHVFVEDDGSGSVTPTVRATADDVRRLRGVTLGLARWRGVQERLLAGLSGRGR